MLGNLDDDVERGLALADRAIAINPNLALAWTIKGYLTALMGDMVDAQRALNEAIRLTPLDTGNLIGVIRSYESICVALRQHEELVGWAKKLLAINPQDVSALVTLLGHAVRLGDTVEASKMLTRIQSLYPHLRKSHLRQMYLRFRKAEHQAAMVERINLLEGVAE